MSESELVLSLLGIATKYLESGATLEQVHPIIKLIHEQTEPKIIKSITISKEGNVQVVKNPYPATSDPALKEPMSLPYYEKSPNVVLDMDKSGIPECCRGCSNHPTNGGSGVCNCALPYLRKTVNTSESLWNVAPAKGNGFTVATSRTINYNTNNTNEVKI